MNWSTVSRNVGYALLVDALFMFFSVLIALFDPADTALGPLSVSFLLTFIVGVFPFIFVRKTTLLSLREAYVIITLSWLLSFIFGMLPYALWGGPFTVVNAWFESVSGFTTTGATVLADVESLPKALLFWRSSTHFIGGLGVVVFLLLLIPESSPMRIRLTNMELSALSKGGYHARSNKTIYIFTYVYLGLVVSSFLLYMLAGMGPFDAINHAFSVSATGGFSTKNISIAGFDSLPITLITMVYMFLASIHFGMLWMVLVTRSLKPLKNEVLRLYTGYLVLVSIIAGVILKIDGLAATWGEAILDGSFSMLSYASTTGLAISDNAGYPFFVSMLMMLVGTVCGMAGSTTGGLKSDRLLILIKSIRAHIIQSLNPSSVTELKLHGTNLQMKDVYPQVLYVALYVFVWMVSVILVLMSGVDTNNAIMATLSSIGNVGPSVGELGTFGNFGLQPSFAKLIYTLDMFMGRVEIYPVLSVIGMMLAPRKRI